MKYVLALLVCLSISAAADDFRCFPLTGRGAIREVPAHFHGNSAIVGDYEGYQLFLIRTASTEKAAFLLLDYKKTLKDPKYLPNMGGFTGLNGLRPDYVFAKGVFLVGVLGLPQDRADPIARQFAARIPLK